MSARRVERGGFALGAVLWVLTVVAVVGATAALQGRSAYEAMRNRTNAERASWTTESCVSEMRERIDHLLETVPPNALQATWRTLDVAVLPQALQQVGCVVSLESVGSAIDVNRASDTLLYRFFRTSLGPAMASGLTDALVDWRDADDVPRPAGAERAWYTANQLPAPRNDSLASIEEVMLVRGFVANASVLANLTVEPSRICLTTAPANVLAALPGFTTDVVDKVLADRVAGVWFVDLATLRGRLPQAAGDSVLAHFQELAALTVVDPEGWFLRVSASSGTPAISITTELRLDRYADRALVVRRRTQ